MSDPQRASLTKQVPQPPTQAAEKHYTDTTSVNEATVYKCTCGTPDTSENWICCDDDDCPVGWHHWGCVLVTEEPVGDWVCPRCSLMSIRKGRLLEVNTSTLSKPGNTTAKDSYDISDHRGKEKVKDKGTRPAKKGIAVKKSTPKKKAQWVECIEMDSDGEEKHKGHQDAIQKPSVVAKGSRTNARASRSKSRMARSQASTSNIAARLKKVMAESGKKK